MMGDMEDQAYARRLFAILTNPHPTGIDPDDPYGAADDGIDRYDGFGRDVWVASVEVVGDKVPASIGGPFNEGVTIDVPGIVNFNHPGGGENIYIQTS